jgi:hypothetical protein
MKPAPIIAITLALGAGFVALSDTEKTKIESDLSATSTVGKTVILQEEAVKQFGRPIQVKKDGDTPESVKVRDLIGTDLPPNTQVDVYETKQGWGYQVIEYGTTTDKGRTFRQWRSTGYGAEAADRTWDWKTIDEYVASST